MDFMDVTVPNEKKKQLLAWLMQTVGGFGTGALQAAGAAETFGNPAAGALGFGHTIFNRSDTRRSDPAMTALSHVGPGIAGLLGPGGRGLAGAQEHSAAPGLPVLMPGHGQPTAPVPQNRPILPVSPASTPILPPAAPQPMSPPGPGMPTGPGVFLDGNTLMLHGRPLTI